MIKQLEESFDKLSSQGHKEWAENYYNENNYHFALFEYENGLIVESNSDAQISDKIVLIKSFINPEEKIIKTCFEKGGVYHSAGDFKRSNKYFTRVMSLAGEDTFEHKFAKSRIVNV